MGRMVTPPGATVISAPTCAAATGETRTPRMLRKHPGRSLTVRRREPPTCFMRTSRGRRSPCRRRAGGGRRVLLEVDAIRVFGVAAVVAALGHAGDGIDQQRGPGAAPRGGAQVDQHPLRARNRVAGRDRLLLVLPGAVLPGVNIELRLTLVGVRREPELHPLADLYLLRPVAPGAGDVQRVGQLRSLLQVDKLRGAVHGVEEGVTDPVAVGLSGHAGFVVSPELDRRLQRGDVDALPGAG